MASELAFITLAPVHFALAGTGQAGPAAHSIPHNPAAVERHNELRVARLEPGKDKLENARAFLGPKYRRVFSDSPNVVAWVDSERERVVRMDVGSDGVIETITVSSIDSLLKEKRPLASAALTSKLLRTGRGLGLGDTVERVVELYGAPNSRGPSTRGSRALEFFFYAFDWAGSDVPQVMEVYCDQRGGRVVEITLAAPTL